MTVAALKNSRTVSEWTSFLNDAWAEAEDHIVEAEDHAGKAIGSAFGLGTGLIEAKRELNPADFTDMITNRLSFSKEKTATLMRLAKHPDISGTVARRNLPSKWTILAKLSKLSGDDFKHAKSKNLISSDTTYREASAIAGAYATPEGEIWGENSHKPDLPPPAQANTIAKKTGRGVAASDGNIYFGHSKAEAKTIESRMHLVQSVRRAVAELAAVEMSAKDFITHALPHQLWPADEEHEISAARDWMEALEAAWKTRK